ncbi:hypothetical protein [Hyphomonas sp.]|uniref:hypothetical protein n=1 Tax=Hyphomonas sp. TaxID=87 RepID=UPI003918BEBA
MTRRVTRNRRSRLLDRRLITLALARGGMLLGGAGVWTAYRTQDARRMQIGLVAPELAAALEAEGVAVRAGSQPPRLVAGPAAEL